MHNVFVEEVNRRSKEFQEKWLREHKIVPVPKPGEKVSFPVACVTGVCFRGDGPCPYRWEDNIGLVCFYDNEWVEAGEYAVQYLTKVTVVDEPKMPEPVWKDCNFIEAVEWMKAQPNENFAKWNGCEYWMSNDHIWRKQTGALLNYNINAVLGKWQIKVEG